MKAKILQMMLQRCLKLPNFEWNFY